MKKRCGCFLIGLCLISCIDCFNLINTELVGSGKLPLGTRVNLPGNFMVISDSIVWKQLVNNIKSAENADSTYKAVSNFRETDIDFSQYAVIACFGKFNGVNYVPIIKILEYNKNIVVHLRDLNPIPGPYVLYLPRAYYIVKIKKTDKPVSFVTE